MMAAIWFLSCGDTDVAKTLRSRCESVIKRDLDHIRWQPRYRGWQDVACRAERRGTSRQIGPSIAAGLRSVRTRETSQTVRSYR